MKETLRTVTSTPDVRLASLEEKELRTGKAFMVHHVNSCSTHTRPRSVGVDILESLTQHCMQSDVK